MVKIYKCQKHCNLVVLTVLLNNIYDKICFYFSIYNFFLLCVLTQLSILK